MPCLVGLSWLNHRFCDVFEEYYRKESTISSLKVPQMLISLWQWSFSNGDELNRIPIADCMEILKLHLNTEGL